MGYRPRTRCLAILRGRPITNEDEFYLRREYEKRPVYEKMKLLLSSVACNGTDCGMCQMLGERAKILLREVSWVEEKSA